MNTCKNCGKELADAVRFCAECGTPVEVIPSAETPLYGQPDLSAVQEAISPLAGAVADNDAASSAVPIFGASGSNAAETPLVQAANPFPAPTIQPGIPAYGQTPPAYPPAYAGSAGSTKKKTGRWILLGVLVVAILVGGFFAGRTLYWNSRYASADNLLTDGAYEEALAIFETLPEDFKDTAAKTDTCQKHVQYDSAMALYQAGNYEQAATAFTALGNFLDAEGMAATCLNEQTYAEATGLYAAGEYYEAYVLFNSISSFRDASAQASACVQEEPVSGEIYRASGQAAGGNVQFTMVNEIDAPVYLDFYDADGSLALTLFARAGETTVVNMNPGTYTFKEGIGGTWFGESDRFGETGDINDVTNPDGTVEEYELLAEQSYTYTIYYY